MRVFAVIALVAFASVVSAAGSANASAMADWAAKPIATAAPYDILSTLQTAEATFCTPAYLVAPEKVPATLTGPSINLTLALGSCNLIKDNKTGDFVLDCFKPEIFLVKKPANFTSKTITPQVFVSKECKLTKPFGKANSSDETLFVFDPTELSAHNSPLDFGSMSSMLDGAF